MKKRITSRYHRAGSPDPESFIHKYYLTPDEKRQLSPIDIDAIAGEFAISRKNSQENYCSITERPIPEQMDGCTIFYKDVGMEKPIEGDLVRRVLLAEQAYWQDVHAELSPEELRAALNLNGWLRGYEKTLLNKYLELRDNMEKGLSGGDPFLTDYEIELKMYFYLREGDPFYDNEESSDYDIDSDTSLICTINYLCPNTTREKAADPEYYGLGDEQDHTERLDHRIDIPIYQARHCTLYDELTRYTRLPHKHLIRIGLIWADFEVSFQNMFRIDLTGEQIVANKEEPFQDED